MARKTNHTEKFLALFEDGDTVAIFMHDTPDPDSMASAMGIQWYLKKKLFLESQIFYRGDISHPQNKTMANALGIIMRPFEEYVSDNYSKTIIVDATNKNVNIDEVSAIIDHHRNDGKAQHCHIEHVGAASTLVWEYIKSSDVTFDNDLDYNVATALYLGIIIDTSELRSDTATNRDATASWELMKILDKKKLDTILSFELPAYFFELRDVCAASGNSTIKDTCWVASVGIIPPTKRDVLPMLADDMIRREGISVAVVISIIGDFLQASVRSRSSVDVNDFCWKIFGKDHSGGKQGMGGARVPLGLSNLRDLNEETRERYYSALKDKLFYQILHVAAGN